MRQILWQIVPYFHSKQLFHINLLPISITFVLFVYARLSSTSGVDFITPLCQLQEIPLSCCLLADLFKPTGYVQCDPDQLDGNAAMHVAGVPVGRVLVNSDEGEGDEGFQVCALIHDCGPWQLLDASALKLSMGGAVWPNAEYLYTASDILL